MSILGTLGSLAIDLRANAAGFESDMGRAAKISEQRSRQIQKGVQDAMKNVAATLAAADIGRRFGEAFKGSINDADNLSKAAQKVAIDIEKLSGLKFAGAFADVEFDALNGGLNLFNKNIIAAADGSKAQKAAFEALGISIFDQNGKLKDNYTLLLEVSDAFERSKDSVDKSAVSMALFGKSGADLIPLLNGGAKGIRDMSDQARQLGLIIDEKTGKAAEEFNDRLTLIEQASKGVFTQVSAGLLPTMNDLAQQFVNWSSQAENTAKATEFVNRVVKGTIVTVLAAKAAFQVFGTVLAAVAAAASRLFENVNAKSFLNPVMLAWDMSKGAGSAFDLLKMGFADASGIAKSGIKSVTEVMRAGEREVGIAANDVVAAASPIEGISYRPREGGGEDKDKKEKQEKAKKNEGPGAAIDAALEAKVAVLQQQKEMVAGFVESNMTVRESAWKTWTDIKNAIVSTTIEGSAERAQLMTAADRKLGDDLTKILEEQLAAQAERQAAYYDELQKLRDQFNAKIQADPVSRMFGVDTLEEMTARMDIMREGLLQFGDGFNQAFSRAGNSLADLITNMALFGEKGELSVKRIAGAFIVDMVHSIVQVGIQMAANQVMALAFGKVVAGAAISQASAIAAAWAPAAAGASLATVGANSVPATAGLASTYGVAQALAATGIFGGGFANGGRPRLDRISMVGERGPELFVPDVPGTIVPNHMWGYGNGGMSGAAAALTIINNAPGLTFTRRGDALTVDMVPDLLKMAVENSRGAVAVDILDGDSRIGGSLSGRVGTPAGRY